MANIYTRTEGEVSKGRRAKDRGQGKEGRRIGWEGADRDSMTGLESGGRVVGEIRQGRRDSFLDGRQTGHNVPERTFLT